MKALCAGGPNDGNWVLVSDQTKFGDQIQVRLPITPIEINEPIYHPFSDKARDRILSPLANYMYMYGILKHIP